VLPIVLGTEVTAKLNALVAFCTGLLASLTRAVKFAVPAAVGVPVNAPLFGLSVTPAGNVPLVTDQLYGRVPPLPVNVALYTTPTVPPGSELVVIANAAGCTVNVVFPLTLPKVAFIIVLPTDTPLANPPALIVATPGTDELHTTWLVTFCVLPSEYVPVAVNGCVPPTGMPGLTGVTAIELNVGGGAPLPLA
jgi:hypothetical protein